MSGWIKLHRELISWEWYTDHNTCRLFIHCILRANHTNTKWRGTQLNRGQFLTSLESLSNETGLSVSQIRTGFKKLESTNEIASLSQARSRIVTVLNYDSYQSDDRLSDRLVAGSSQADSKLIATDKNVITKEVNNKTIDHSQKDEVKEDLITPAFDFFWSKYPRKISKKKAKQKFTVLAKGKNKENIRGLVNLIHQDIMNKLKTFEWLPEDELEFIPHPATYLNAETWNDHE